MVALSAEQMAISGFAGAGLAWEDGDQRTGWRGSGADFGRGGRGKPVEGCRDGWKILEGVEPIGAGAQLSGRLWTAQQQETEYGCFITAQMEGGARVMLELTDTAEGSVKRATCWPSQAGGFKLMEGGTHLVLGEIEHGIPG